ncbi:hypothetical protein F4811DRAFT_223681 [Daldinia bambusicola]|nr:hypothetical protein F4811DRAFT_223681 [Daldinia bambusicola]
MGCECYGCYMVPAPILLPPALFFSSLTLLRMIIGQSSSTRPMEEKNTPHAKPCPSSNLFPLWASMQPTQANRPTENSQNGPQPIPILGNMLASTSPFSIYLCYVVYLPTCRARHYRRFPSRARADAN